MPTLRETTSVRIHRDSYATLQAMAGADGVSLTDELDRIIEGQRRKRLFDEAHRAYAELRKDEAAWDEVEEERASLEGTLTDGLGASMAKLLVFRRGVRRCHRPPRG